MPKGILINQQIPPAEYRSPVDFTVTYTSEFILTLAGLSITITNSAQLVYVKRVNRRQGLSSIFINGINGITLTWDSTNSRIQIHGLTAGEGCSSDDVFEIGINEQQKGFGGSGSGMDVTNLNSDHDHFIDPVPLVSASDIGAVNDTWKDQGAEIDCRSYKTLVLWVVFTVNDSTGNQLQVLQKHESAGADEYVEELASDYQKVIGDASIKIKYTFELDNSISFVQIQTKATLIGATEGTVTINYTLGY